MFRRLKVKFIFSIGIIPLCLGAPGGAAADCQCPNQGSLRDSYSQAATVFVGTVEKFGPSALRPSMNEFQVRLMSRIKGLEEVKGNSLWLYTPNGPEKCGMKLLVGQDYLFFADGSIARFVVTSCSRTQILDNALDQMEELQKIAGGKK